MQNELVETLIDMLEKSKTISLTSNRFPAYPQRKQFYANAYQWSMFVVIPAKMPWLWGGKVQQFQALRFNLHDYTLKKPK